MVSHQQKGSLDQKDGGTEDYSHRFFDQKSGRSVSITLQASQALHKHTISKVPKALVPAALPEENKIAEKSMNDF